MFRVKQTTAKKTEVDGIEFASKAEARRYGQLKMLEQARAIKLLKLQPHFDFTVNKQKVGRGYTADFMYFDIGRDKWIVEEVKGRVFRDWPLRRDLFKALYGYAYTLEVLCLV
jgi:hypothetical protein